MKEKIRNYIRNEICTEKTEFTDNESLYDNGVLDSLKIVQLAVFLQDEFHIVLSPADMRIEDFETVDNIIAYVKRLQGGK